jgi:UDP-perosamine 4-acetyltransferase
MVVGAGGHARVVADILGLDPTVRIIGVADWTASTNGESVGKTHIVTTIEDRGSWRRLGATAAALAVGDNEKRAKLFAELETEGWDLISAVHPTAFISESATRGRACVVCAGAVICTEVTLGQNVLVNTRAVIDHECSVAPHAHIGPGTVLAGRVRVGQFTFIGAGSTVRDNISIGERCVVGAGSVVVESVPDSVVAFGVPARVRRAID